MTQQQSVQTGVLRRMIGSRLHCLLIAVLFGLLARQRFVHAEDGSIQAEHLSQADKSMSELGPRVLRGYDSVDGDRFGRAVALGPDLALVGADSAPCARAEPGGECDVLRRGK